MSPLVPVVKKMRIKKFCQFLRILWQNIIYVSLTAKKADHKDLQIFAYIYYKISRSFLPSRNLNGAVFTVFA